MNISIRPAATVDADAIARIYNQGIDERGATFETAPRSAEDIRTRLRDHAQYPVLVAEDAGTVIGWAGLSSYRPRPCYAGIAEFSIYLDRTARGRGVGRQLLEALITAARERGFWKLVSRVFPFNTASRALCRACGFREVGVYEKHGCLDGRWTDVVIVERLLPENLTHPGLTPAARSARISIEE
jgi:L-amino acid N-acyltransferase YncA